MQVTPLQIAKEGSLLNDPPFIFTRIIGLLLYYTQDGPGNIPQLLFPLVIYAPTWTGLWTRTEQGPIDKGVFWYQRTSRQQWQQYTGNH